METDLRRSDHSPFLPFLEQPECWEAPEVLPVGCLYSANADEGELGHGKRLLDRCLGCERFLPEGAHNGVVGHLADEVRALRVKVGELSRDLEVSRRQLRLMDQVTPLFQTSANPDEVIAVALTAVTAGKGLGLNRAILLLLDPDGRALQGRLAVGPRSREEAARIWPEIERQNFSLYEMARLFLEHRMAEERAKFQDLLEELSTPLSRQDHLFVKSLRAVEALYVEDLDHEPAIDRSQVEALDVRELVLVPIATERGRLGLLLADNLVDGRHLCADELKALSLFGRHVAQALERARSRGRLEEEVRRIAEANERLKQQQEAEICREKIALTEKIAAAVAHSIRNPLTVIGGFARRLLRSTPAEDPRRGYVDTIVQEARRLEDVLQEIVEHSEGARASPSAGSLEDLVRWCYAELLEHRREAEIRLRLESLSPVQMDARRTAYCLKALARRALDAMDPAAGGYLEIATQTEEGRPEVLLTAVGLAPGELDADSPDYFAFPDEIGCSRGLFLCAQIMEGQGAALRVEDLGGGRVRFRLSFRAR